MKKFLAAALFAALFSGCSSIKICDVGGHTIAVVENSGWYLFDCIPLASGNPDNPNGHMCRFFTDTVTLENNVKLLDEAVKRTGAKGCKDVVSYTTDENVLIILFGRYYFHTTAELVMPDETAEAAEPAPPERR